LIPKAWTWNTLPVWLESKKKRAPFRIIVMETWSNSGLES
jgi:hypothetical protein